MAENIWTIKFKTCYGSVAYHLHLSKLLKNNIYCSKKLVLI